MFSILITLLTENPCNIAMRSFTQIAVTPLRVNSMKTYQIVVFTCSFIVLFIKTTCVLNDVPFNGFLELYVVHYLLVTSSSTIAPVDNWAACPVRCSS